MSFTIITHNLFPHKPDSICRNPAKSFVLVNQAGEEKCLEILPNETPERQKSMLNAYTRALKRISFQDLKNPENTTMATLVLVDGKPSDYSIGARDGQDAQQKLHECVRRTLKSLASGRQDTHTQLCEDTPTPN